MIDKNYESVMVEHDMIYDLINMILNNNGM